MGRNDPDRWLPEAGQSTGFSAGPFIAESERPSGLTQAIIEVGRINKTLYLLNYIDDEDYRRRILTQLNREKVAMPLPEPSVTVKKVR